MSVYERRLWLAVGIVVGSWVLAKVATMPLDSVLARWRAEQ